jgi:hypothetical protein
MQYPHLNCIKGLALNKPIPNQTRKPAFGLASLFDSVYLKKIQQLEFDKNELEEENKRLKQKYEPVKRYAPDSVPRLIKTT